MNILRGILEEKRKEVEKARSLRSLDQLRSEAAGISVDRPFAGALDCGELAVIAEIKKASPSRGVLIKDFDHRSLAREYEQGGARALSVLTDEKFFQGRKEFINEVKRSSNLPVLRKDFIVDEYQVYESKVIGADAILLIIRVLEGTALRSLYECARSLGLDVLVEAHTADEISAANKLGAEIIGINNRDLETFDVSLQHSVRLREKIHPDAIAVSESGIKNVNDVTTLRTAGFDAILVGEGLITTSDRVHALRSLVAS